MKKIHILHTDPYINDIKYQQLLSSIYNLRIIDFGDCVRTEIKSGTEFSKKIRSYNFQKNKIL